ncbi:polypeptide deformylase [Chondrocystis sp. NIES-4102]|nr:polypeptide deformylase [Chondrocystis sp. NIES-4102]
MNTVIAVEKKKLDKPPLDIHYLGDRVLRQPAKRVAKVDDEIRKIVKEMLQTMYSADGIGLAAPQVGIHKQIIVIDIYLDKPDKAPLVLINPKIIKFGKTLCNSEEGCLSIPGVYLDVSRPDEIEVSYKNEQGKPSTIKATGLLSRAIQHEMDHLNGVMFVDRVENSLALNEELHKKGFAVSAVKPVKK